MNKTIAMKLLLAVVFLTNHHSMSAQSGFASSADLRLGYSDKVFNAALGYDLGYKWKDMLYLGVGPVVTFATGNGNSTYAGGGYGKLRFTAPIHFEIKPFIEGRGGYNYNFKTEDGGMLYGAAIGVKYKKFVVGFHLDISSTTTSITKTTSSYVQYSNRRDVINGKTHTPSGKVITSTSTTEDTDWNLTPSFLIGIEF